MTEEEKKLLKPLLWDTDSDLFDEREYSFALIERVLTFGTAEHIRWLLKKYSEEEIRAVVKKSIRIDKRTANYWAIKYNISRTEIKCFNRQLTQDFFY
jgi:hypothetical protein